MEVSVIRTGFTGSGFAARFHYEGLRGVRSARPEIIGAFSRNPAKLAEFTGPLGIRAFESLEEMLESVDVVHVCTPPSTHEFIVVEALKRDRHVIVEKPFTGYFGDGSEGFSGDSFPREAGLEKALQSIRRMLDAERSSKGSIMYAENWIYVPAIQKEREVIEKTGAQVLWIQAQQGHSGSHSPDYGRWRLSGGGSLIGKGCHPMSAAIYLKHAEGRTRSGKPIHPMSISVRTHAITRMPLYEDLGHLRRGYTDIEDYALAHVVFQDGTMADITASELVHGGVKNCVEVHANNHRTICNIAPNNAMQTYNPVEDNFRDIYVVEKTGTKQGWSNISPDEGWFNGYQHEMEAFYRFMALGTPIESDSSLAADVIATIYAGYVSAERNGTEVPVTIQH
jgi:predicted dehydrogenase